MPGRLANSRRGRILSISALRSLARVIVHLQPQRLGQVSEAWEGVFHFRAYGLPLKYQLGSQDNVGNTLLWCGCRHIEPDTFPTFIQRARTARGVLDIGANTGLYAMIACAANPDVRVIAWEPVPYLHQRCVANLKLNNFENRSEVRSTAASDRSGSAPIYISEESTTASLNQAHQERPATPVNVILETVDEAIAPDFPVDLVKLDVETHEYEALCGMRRTLEKWHPTVIFELLPSLSAGPIEALFNKLGYRLYRLTKNGAVPVDHIDPAQTVDHNFLALHSSKDLES